jgi:anaerobic magnesium-protoporphyrin IX monomethyl ester cyclase
MLKVLLVNPPLTYSKASVAFDLHFPIGLMYVAAAVRSICQVEIFDCLTFEIKNRNQSLTNWGASPDIIKKKILEKMPDVVGISVPSTAQYKNAELVAMIAKQVNPKIITVFGGPDPSVRFNSILKNSYCDYCVIGEGEQTFFELISKLSVSSSCENVKGLAYMHDGSIHYEPRPFCKNIDTLPFPALDLIDVNKYLSSKYLYAHRSGINRNSISIITSRGCPNNCVFCSIKLHMGQCYRSHSPEYVMKLIHYYINNGITNFHFEDDNLTLDNQRFEKLLDCIIKEKLRIRWDTPNGVRVDSLNYDLLKKIKQSGCAQLVIAIESGNQRVLDEIIHKKIKLESAIQIAKYCKELKIPLEAFYVIGFPGEKISEMLETINFALRLYSDYEVAPYLMVATPLYGTDLYEKCKRDKLLQKEPDFDELGVAIQSWGDPMIATADFSIEDITRILKRYNKTLSTQRISHRLKRTINLLKINSSFLLK